MTNAEALMVGSVVLLLIASAAVQAARGRAAELRWRK